MTFVDNSEEKEKQRKKEDEAIEKLQEKKRKDLEDAIKKRNQDIKNHKPNVQNLDIPANQEQQMAIPPVAIINNLLIIIAGKNFPPITDIKDIDPKLLDSIDTPLGTVINDITKSIEGEFQRAGKEFDENEQLKYANQIFACLRELKKFDFITIIPNTEEGILVRINAKALAYINAVGYLVPVQDFRNQYAVYHSLCLT